MDLNQANTDFDNENTNDSPSAFETAVQRFVHLKNPTIGNVFKVFTSQPELNQIFLVVQPVTEEAKQHILSYNIWEPLLHDLIIAISQSLGENNTKAHLAVKQKLLSKKIQTISSDFSKEHR